MKKLETKVEKIPISGCWIWMGQLHHSGYGVWKRQAAHRLVYEKLVEDIPMGLHVLHRCDIPCCVNPNHLFVGTHTDNMQDKVKKGRSYFPIGNKNGRTHLTEQDILEIRSDTRTIKEVAKAFGIGKSQVSNIKSRLSWKHI